VTALGLSCTQEVGTVANLRYFNLPVLLRVMRADSNRGLAVLTGVTETTATLALETGPVQLPLPVLEKEWGGNYTLIWQPPPGGALLIATGAGGEPIRWLRRTLAQVPNLPGREALTTDEPVFDAALIEAVKAFQRLRGLQADGVAGARTLIQLNLVAGVAGIPRLTEPSANTAGAQP
jgi:general secretion pathway protein A